MDWKAFFDDLQKWMAASNQVLQRCPFDSDDYWTWLVQSVGQLGNKYNNHPLVNGILSAVVKYQDDIYQESVRR
ncbi:hypothetical protein [Enterococcus sp.]|uniref:hypothetical protein n=1 Tax=Enterococcus sp. TaxID=35783 RepID=UPI003C70A1D3